MTTRTTGRRAGFTLIELLVVILIIGVLVSLLVVGVSSVRVSARKAEAATDIAQVANGLASFKAKMNVGYIPAFRFEKQANATFAFGKFRLRATYPDAPAAGEPGSNSFEFAYLRQVFPQIGATDPGTNSTGVTTPQDLDPNQMLVTFLTGGLQTNYRGFSTNRARPFSMPGDNALGPFLEFKATKYTPEGRLIDPFGVPFAYFAFDPSFGSYPNNNNVAATSNGQPTAVIAPFANGYDGTYQVDGTAIAPNNITAFYTPGVAPQPIAFHNPKGFQLVSAGPDQVFGRGGAWVPGQGDYVSVGTNVFGGDDLSNFNEGPLNQKSK